MKRSIRILLSVLLSCAMLFSTAITSFAHSGRTDSDGGHRDNKNKSGLGSYHYHCGGYPAHLHDYGYCPYRDVFPKSVSLSVGKTTIYIGQKTKIKAKVSPSNACDKDVSLSSSNTKVVKVSGNQLEGVGSGTATITAKTFNGKKKTIKITVKKAKPEKVTVSSSVKKDQTIYIGDTFKVSAKVTPKYVKDKSVKWSSNKKKIATVDKKGNVTALKAGEVTITATATNGVVGKKTFTIKERKVKSVTIPEEKLQLFLNDTYQLSATIKPANATYPTLKWTSSNPDVVEVSKDGMLVAKGVGKATITATAKSKKSASVSVKVSEVIAESITIVGASELYLNRTYPLTAEIYPENTSVKDVVWSTSDPAIAEIDENGFLTCLATGAVTITATQKDVETSIDTEVKIKPVEQIEISSSAKHIDKLPVGSSMSLTATVYPEDATYRDVTWTSSDPNIATVDTNGNVTGIASGNVVIMVQTLDGFMHSHEVKITPTIKSLFNGIRNLFSR